jgi:hypothetical protein
MKIFLTLMVFWCLTMTTYYHFTEPENVSTVVWWAMLTLFNNQNLIKLYNEKDKNKK